MATKVNFEAIGNYTKCFIACADKDLHKKRANLQCRIINHARMHGEKWRTRTEIVNGGFTIKRVRDDED
jgi:hypothetical protein